MPLFIGTAFGCVFGIFISAKFPAIKFGDWGEWVGAFATFAAVIASLWIANKSHQASFRVDASITTDLQTIYVEAFNDGMVPIYVFTALLRDGRLVIDNNESEKRILPGMSVDLSFEYSENAINDPKINVMGRSQADADAIWKQVKDAKKLRIEVGGANKVVKLRKWQIPEVG